MAVLFTQHRHFGYTVVLVAQFDRMIDRQIRSLIEYEYVHRKLSNFGLKGMLLNLAMGGRTFVSVKIWYPMKEKVGQEFFMPGRNYIGYMIVTRHLNSGVSLLVANGD